MTDVGLEKEKRNKPFPLKSQIYQGEYQAQSLITLDSAKLWEICSPSFVLQVPEYIRLTVGTPKYHWKVSPVNQREAEFDG
ncbi:hypothetical protein [Nostoc sp. MG11]|uniref:hypothetical protein n=1 Tax=Nostoc sp. MG11 TaxID=2721166 RepID=UPI00186769D3|nr:hypothetical protein [Nostoc sp. MG11]